MEEIVLVRVSILFVIVGFVALFLLQDVVLFEKDVVLVRVVDVYHTESGSVVVYSAQDSVYIDGVVNESYVGRDAYLGKNSIMLASR